MQTLSSLLLASVMLVSSATLSLAETPQNRYRQTNLVANLPKYNAQITDAKLINAWGIANRPAGAGGHIWVGADKTSFQYVGDVHASSDPKLQKLFVDDLPYISVPTGGDEAVITGVIFSGSDKNFVITQSPKDAEPITAPAKFLFTSDGGIVSAWTERKKADGSFDRALDAAVVFDQSQEGAAFFGMAASHDYSRIYLADFGKKPTILTLDGAFKPMDIAFDQPFDDNKNGVVDAGEFAPFNIQAFTLLDGAHRLFVAYAKTQPCPKEAIAEGVCKEGEIFPAEEDTVSKGAGRLAEFDEDGKLIAVWQDGEHLSAPWGLAFAPKDFGALSGALLVANFGDGTIAAYDPASRSFKDYLRNETGEPVKIDKIWGLLFGNGASLGDSNALYFTAGPEDETEGLFGSLRVAP